MTTPNDTQPPATRLREHVRVLRKALEPFAAHATRPHLDNDDDILVGGFSGELHRNVAITVGHCRAAKAALAATDHPGAERETKERKERCDVCGKMVSEWTEPVVGKRVCRPCETKYFLGVD